MSKMFNTYDKAFWDSLVLTVTADTIYTAFSTYCSVDGNSTTAMGAVPGGTSIILMQVAYEPPINRTWLLYGYTS
jgi:hypothetical protein